MLGFHSPKIHRRLRKPMQKAEEWERRFSNSRIDEDHFMGLLTEMRSQILRTLCVALHEGQCHFVASIEGCQSCGFESRCREVSPGVSQSVVAPLYHCQPSAQVFAEHRYSRMTRCKPPRNEKCKEIGRTPKSNIERVAFARFPGVSNVTRYH